MLLIFLVFCVGLFFCVFVLCLVYPMLPVSLDCPFLIAPSVFSNDYLFQTVKKIVKDGYHPLTWLPIMKTRTYHMLLINILLRLELKISNFIMIWEGTQSKHELLQVCHHSYKTPMLWGALIMWLSLTHFFRHKFHCNKTIFIWPCGQR
jgi:hypothetical protein